MTTFTPPAVPVNYSFHAIAGAYALVYPPHLYTCLKTMSISTSAWTNLTPRSNIDGAILKTKVDSSTWQKLIKARGCHLNALEGFPLFAAAMLAGNYANLGVKEMNFCAAQYLTARVLYSVLYMSAKSEAMSYLRSTTYFWSVGVPFYVLWKAGNRLAEKI